MSEFAVEGPDIKRMMKLAKKKPIAFAFNPGSSDDEHLLAMHRKKPPEILGKAAKKDGAGNKAAFGTCTVSGKILSLTCEREVPAMAKKLKRYLKSQKVQLNVQILDANGNVLEEDIEDLPDDPEMDEDLDEADAGDDAAAAAAPAAAAPGAAAAEADAAAGIDTAALTARLKELQPRIKAAPEAAAAKLTAAFKAVVDLIKGGQLAKAEDAVGKLEAILDKLGGGVAGAAAESAAADPDKAKWDDAAARLEPDVGAALRNGAVDANRLRAVWAFAQDKAADGDYAAALRATVAVEALLQPPAPARPTVSVVAFQKSRILWLDAKKKMANELAKLRTAIVKQSSDDEDADEIVEAADEMIAEFDAFDSRLEDVLDEITNAEDGPDRAALRRRAIAVIAEFNKSLDSPFFRSVDDNPFEKVSVSSTARQSLATIQKTLE